jgi:hypothetical protein
VCGGKGFLRWFSLPLRERVRVRGIENVGTLTSFLSRRRLCRNREKCITVILSKAKNLTFPATY